MEKYVYIKKSIAKHFVDFAEPLSTEEYNNIGETWGDYLSNKWVLLSAEQVTFLNEHPTASVEEVWNMELTPPYVPPTPTPAQRLQQAKDNKIREIEEYDQSSAVNSFRINGQDMWLSVEEREQIATQISASEAGGRETMTRWFDGHEYTFPLSVWRQMLVALELYAGDALNVTESHKAYVNGINLVERIQEIEDFDVTADYPEKLVFGETSAEDEPNEEEY